ncbi:Zn-dependent hydrolase [Rhizobium jaguaris]|uniref:Zn-dependent hydrolase n=1 Tax=Rhizobium jaguaris TaxID=1312183 RepID=A0A387FUZ0_9HYPH|nr:Zn-dependent hydrolase [Rhizobium jaguaris]AYG62499.1 Zn-dependent hydrolase [Rhizobium jaguaris]
MSVARKPTIASDRLWADLMALGEITEPGAPYTRRSFSPMFVTGREWLRQRFHEAGLDTRLDAGGNLIGRLTGSDPKSGTIMIGSHSDSVPSGGRFDGIAGVIVGIELVRALRDAGCILKHAIEVVDFLAEEPSEYGLSCVGSRAMAGRLSEEMLCYRNAQGELLAAAIDRMGGDVANLMTTKRNDVVSFLELHIEQGRVLEEARVDLGIVSAIASVTRAEIHFEGRADHAGTTPMHLRSDAGLAAAATLAFVAAEAARYALMGHGHFVATTGVLNLSPNAANVVPSKAHLIIDIRAEDAMLTDSFLSVLEKQTEMIAQTSHVKRAGWKILSTTKPAQCDPDLRRTLRDSAKSLGYSTLDMASGAGHDAAFIATFAPSAMIFVPCRDGRSHTPDEWAEPTAIAAGASTLLETIMRLDETLNIHSSTEISI